MISLTNYSTHVAVGTSLVFTPESLNQIREKEIDGTSEKDIGVTYFFESKIEVGGNVVRYINMATLN